jgi:hypothetical protein
MQDMGFLKRLSRSSTNPPQPNRLDLLSISVTLVNNLRHKRVNLPNNNKTPLFEALQPAMPVEKHVQHPKNIANNLHFIQPYQVISLANPGRRIRVRSNNRPDPIHPTAQSEAHQPLNVGQ